MYDDVNGNKQELPDNKFNPEGLSDDVLKRIIKATHIDDLNGALSNYGIKGNLKVGSNKDISWPNNYNFNFYHAKIKLMADIDLAGIDWIPIGFDFAVHDTSVRQDLDNKSSLNYTSVTHKQGSRRIFCGTFDGNGHTIYNLHNKRFAANVRDEVLQGKNRLYDNVQWMPSGLFGMIGAGATIRDLKLVDVDLYGYHTAGAIAGIAISEDDSDDNAIHIENCTVDGANIYLSPMLRGDNYNNGTSYGFDVELNTSRTYARGIYAGGIIGHMVSKSTASSITNCIVRNATIRAYRRVGGILGSISNSEQGDYNNDNYDITISNNTLSNVSIIVDKFQPYHRLFCDIQTGTGYPTTVWKNGYGWNPSQRSFGGLFVGGFDNDNSNKYYQKYKKYNDEVAPKNLYEVKLAEFSTNVDAFSIIRTSEIQGVSLSQLPMLSSLLTDTISLADNFYGKPSAKTKVVSHTVNPWMWGEYSNDKITYNIDLPINLPYDLSVDYDESGSNAGIYVESVILDGNKNPVGNRSVITAEDVQINGDCVMFVTSRDRKQFVDAFSTLGIGNQYKKPTIIRNVVLRGTPFAYTGLLIAPNENMSEVNLYNVAIYDVYQTIAKVENCDASKVDLLLNNCNLRGYTVPGSGWRSITFDHTTFEEGVYIKSVYGATGGNKEQAYTYKAEADAKFKHCYFKAPYVIDFNGKTLTFAPSDNDATKLCYATAQSSTNVPIDTTVKPEGETVEKVTKIRIISDVAGNPIVIYYYDNAATGYGHNGKKFTGKTYNATGAEI